MKSTKDKILQTLLRKPKITINDLAEAVGINPISVRHHLTNLQMEGLIAAEEERHGVGRPRLVYSLTEDGMGWFGSSVQVVHCYTLRGRHDNSLFRFDRRPAGTAIFVCPGKTVQLHYLVHPYLGAFHRTRHEQPDQ